jgi:DNA polymerase-1
MRLTGAHVDETALRELEVELAADLDTAREKVYISAGREFNLNSPPQRSAVLYGPVDEGGQGLKCKRRTKKGGTSTDADALEYHRGNAVVDALLEHAGIYTLQSTYVHAYLGDGTKPGALINGRIHTDFVQYGTVTGRFSSREPNLQNIPRPDQPRSKKVRGLFTAAPGCKLIVGDYAQIELRILAHFVGRGALFEGFMQGVDAHVATAAALFKVGFEAVTKAMRQVAKGVNFAIVFGAGPDTVADMSGVSLKEAKRFMEIHERAFPEIYSFRERVLAACRSSVDHSTRTLLGRKRRVADIVSRVDGFRHRAERQAFNAKIQGSNGDLNKLAMIRAHERLPEGAKLILTVHDELVVEAAEQVVREAEAALREAMLGEEIQKLLSVPLVSDLVVCDRWSEAK